MTDQPAGPVREADYFDFDAWHGEHVAATIPFRLLGRDWQLPGDAPAAELLKLQRIERFVIDATLNPDTATLPTGLSEEDIAGFSYESIVRALIGDDLTDEWLTLGIPSEMLRAVSKRLFAIYSGRDADTAMGLGKAPAPRAPQDRKKKTPKKRASTSSAGS